MKKALVITGALICGFLCNALICCFFGFILMMNTPTFILMMIIVAPGLALVLNNSARKFDIYSGVFISCTQLPIFVCILANLIINRTHYEHTRFDIGINLSYSFARGLCIPIVPITICAYIMAIIKFIKERNQNQ